MSKLMKSLMAGALVFAVAACSKQGPETAQAPDAGTDGGKPAIGLAVSTQSNPFFVTLKKGAEEEAQKQGLTLITVDAQDDPAKQIASIEDLIQKKVKVILVNPTDSDAVVGAVKAANAAGIPVVTLDRSVNGGEVASHVASDNVAGGKMAAEYLLEKIGNQGDVVELEGIPGASAARERGQGFHDVIDQAKDVKVVGRQPADFDRAKGLSVMENILQANKNVKGVFAHNDEMALGAVQALEAAGMKDVTVVGFDATDDAVNAVKAGKMSATVAQKPELIGKTAVDAAKKIIDGQPVDKSLPVPLDLVKQ
ncbi:ribose ABC transporter substrate-binding protein RbsB [Laribacter hongkongensis]|mgnify:CR=1 FL=1|uniref:ribose ABC transporter substrate-binding protein RbsB n=1 Tax=Laribacter hongkongensis TaxID=168471 RepID=UPI001EFC96F0|nr:ribose ABC transporter substrate-binding protein RbsB [Laribacter hongkongensis]MCG8994719.1 ribose ABC transporter substrate-binding protein RbsB [Laribacter hongkongensis]MCG9009502.1 ribose ABC transporter substrate-binding protein RbsB [Laribacter hongkongensis]MCG9021597.1 ribose ABC transporter substrate-binding protein RbsB [Laribacter hongkongensis]MCG9032040.1 ribose ABC transporter substrate-binding protein RbsB [Laribacter hongkongensis]MCG9045788.1 ribose ABC transporter substra